MQIENTQIVSFDLEATGLGEGDEIIQIGACTRDSSFNVYITPSKPVNPVAEKITRLQKVDGYLHLNCKRVYSKPPEKAFKEFLDYLGSLKKEIILVAHNCFNFDMPRIMKLAAEVGYLIEFKSVVIGFSDSLIMIRSVLKERNIIRRSFSMKNLVKDFIGEVENLHDASCDAEMLMMLLDRIGVSDKYIIENAKLVEGLEVPLPSEVSWRSEETMDLEIPSYSEVPWQSKLPSKVPRYYKMRESVKDFGDVLPLWVINRMLDHRIDIDILKRVFYKHHWNGIYILFADVYYGTSRVSHVPQHVNKACKELYKEFSMMGITMPIESLWPNPNFKSLIMQSPDLRAAVNKILLRGTAQPPSTISLPASTTSTTLPPSTSALPESSTSTAQSQNLRMEVNEVLPRSTALSPSTTISSSTTISLSTTHSVKPNVVMTRTPVPVYSACFYDFSLRTVYCK